MDSTRDAAQPDEAEILRRTSRTFALSIQALPGAMREPVQVAYLIARAADTISDTELSPRPARAALLAELRGALLEGGAGEARAATRIAGLSVDAAGLDATARAEAALLTQIEPLFERYRALPAADRDDVARVLDRLIATMQGELAYFDGRELRALDSAAELTGYTEGIAGCVGVFWTSLVCRHRLRSMPPKSQAALEIAGRRYGRGLQLVNILRDLPRDLARGVCFLPAEELARASLRPADLTDPGAQRELTPVVRRWEERARHGLLTGLAYAARLGGGGWSLRLATALPAAIGLATLDAMRRSDRRLDPDHKIGITRGELRRIVVRGALSSFCPRGPLSLAR